MKPPSKSVTFPIFSYCMILCLQAVEGAEIPKLFNNIALNLPGSWNGGVIPGSSDVGLWNDAGPATVTAVGSLSPLGGDLSIGGIKVTNVAGTRNLGTNYVGYHSANSANTLTIGAGGIDCSTATQAFYASSKVTIGADQTWNIANANTNVSPAGSNNNEDLNFQAQVGATPFNFGGKTVTTTGAGQITIASGYTLGTGTLNVGNNWMVIQGGTNRATTLNGDLNLVVNSTLRLQANSGAGGISLASAAPTTVNNGGILEYRMANDGFSLTQSGNITLNQGSTLSMLVDNSGPGTISGGIAVMGATILRSSGGGNPANGTTASGPITGPGVITYQNTATNTNGVLILTGNNSGYTGTFTVDGASGNRRLRISNANSGSAAATWNIAANNTLQVQGVSAQFGTLTGAGAITNPSTLGPSTLNVGAGSFSGIISNGASQLIGLNKVGAGRLELLGANTYSGPTTVTAGQLVLTTSQIPAIPADFTVADAAMLTLSLNEITPTLQSNNFTLGSTVGGTFEVALGAQSNPVSPAVAATNLLVNGTNTVAVSGINLTTGDFPLIQYTTLGGTSGFGGLALKLPARTLGSLTNTGGVIGVHIASTQQIKWVGNVSDNWDIDPDGTATSGTPNWKTTGTATSTATRYLQGAGGTDIVNFDNTSTGSGTVNLTAALSPGNISVNNSTKAYTFTGPGKITGTTGLVKDGSGTLTLANTTANDYLGATLINQGTVRLGDGVTVGAGSIASSSISNEGTLILNRPEDHAFNNTLTGGGTLEKAGTNTVTLGTANLYGPLVLTAGKLVINNGGSLSGMITGTGQLEVAGGTLSLNGSDANSNTSPVIVSAGQLRLEKAPDTLAVGGDLTIQGTGSVAIVSNEQIPDTATINVLGSSIDALAASFGTETFANANINGTPDTQLLLRNFSVITGTATVNQGLLGVASIHTGTVRSLVMTSPTALVRVSGNTGASVLNIGDGGITASAGEIQVKYNGNNQDATLNLAGGLTATGNLTISNGGYAGASLNVVNLSDGTHTFNIGASTTTTFAPDIGGTGSLVKTGAGTLSLGENSTAAHTGGTTVSQGTMIVNGSLQGAASVGATATIGGNGTLAGATTVDGTVAPGVTAGKLTTAGITFAPGSRFICDIANWAGTTPGTDWDELAADTLTLAATAGNKLTIRIAGTPVGFTETAKTLTIATSTNPLAGFDASAIAIDATAFSGTGTWTVRQTGNTLELVYAPGATTPYASWATANGLDDSNKAPGLDPDQDGAANFLEFALNGNPLSGIRSGKVSGKVATVGSEKVLTLTIPVRSAAAFGGDTEQTLTVDGLTYHVQGSDGLTNWGLSISEVTGADATSIQSTMPELQPGWFYRTFRSPGPIVGDPSDFLRVRVDSSN